MTERDCFMKAICESREVDLPRLAFADWLDEHDEPERAEFIRVQCELWNHPVEVNLRNAAAAGRMAGGLFDSSVHLEWKSIRERVANLFGRRIAREIGSFMGSSLPRFDWGDMPLFTHRWAYDTQRETKAGAGLLSRGFVEEITCAAEDWLRVEAALTWCCAACTTCLGAGRILDSGNEWKPHPDCHYCSGSGKVPPTMDVRGPDDHCPMCFGSGQHEIGDCSCAKTVRLFRPFPSTAQPIREVHLTTFPDWEHASAWEGANYPNNSGNAFICPRWPGITFHLPW